MTRQYFGTDGVRGRVGEAPITPELVLKLGWAAGLVLAADSSRDGVRPAVLIGKDTRISGLPARSGARSRACPRRASTSICRVRCPRPRSRT